jgi:hypothetical protein
MWAERESSRDTYASYQYVSEYQSEKHCAYVRARRIPTVADGVMSRVDKGQAVDRSSAGMALSEIELASGSKGHVTPGRSWSLPSGFGQRRACPAVMGTSA